MGGSFGLGCNDLLLTDFEADGDVDISLGGTSWRSFILVNDGAGGFESHLVDGDFNCFGTRVPVRRSPGATVTWIGECLDIGSGAERSTLEVTALPPSLAVVHQRQALADWGSDANNYAVQADLDSDGVDDLLGAAGPSMELRLTREGLDFVRVTAPLPPDLSLWPTWIVAADVDGDGADDFVGCPTSASLRGTPSAFCVLVPNNGDGSLSIRVPSAAETAGILSPYGAARAQVGDLDDDGRDELYQLDPEGAFIVRWAQEVANGPLVGELQSLSTPLGPSGRIGGGQLADLTGDGIPDMLLKAENSLLLLPGTSARAFDEAAAMVIDFEDLSPADETAFADFNGDGTVDIASCEGSPGLDVAVFISRP